MDIACTYIDTLVEIRELERGRRVTLHSLDGPTPFNYRYTLGPSGDRGTRPVLEDAITGEGLAGPAGLLAPLAHRLSRSGMTKNLRSLKHTLETSDTESRAASCPPHLGPRRAPLRPRAPTQPMSAGSDQPRTLLPWRRVFRVQGSTCEAHPLGVGFPLGRGTSCAS